MNSNFRKITTLIIWVFVSQMLVVPSSFSGPATHEEFPNYFSELPPEVAQKKIHKAMDSLLRRLQVPYVENGKIRNDGFFVKLQEKISEQDPHAQPYIAGGVVRSLLGYLYKKVYSAKQKNPHADVGEILDHIATREKEVASLSALGIGSDLDILLDNSQRHIGAHLKKEAQKFINSAETKLELGGSASKLKYAFVPIGDVKDYHEQIQRTTSQGGSTLDWLVFPLPRKDGTIGEIREPSDRSYGIMHRFLKGEYDYLPPQGKSEDTDKQTVRGLRPLLEIPFLKLTPTGEQQMQKELEVLKEKIGKREGLSRGALEQFGKLVRNARFEGGHNRFHVSENVLEKTALEISTLSTKGEKGLPLIPEFLNRRDPLRRQHKELPAGLSLLPVEEFIKKYTENGEGTLFHGTPKLDTILNMMRNGMIVSNSKQGAALMGSGAYTTRDFNIAKIYAGNDGVVIPMPIKKELNPRILNLDDPNIAGSPVLQEIKRNAASQKRELNEYLSTEYGIDIIVNEHVLIQNAAVLKTPKKLKDLISLTGTQAKAVIEKYRQNPSRQISRDEIMKLESFASYAHLGQALQIAIQEMPETWARSAFLDLQNSDSSVQRANTIWILQAIKPSDKEIHLALSHALKDEDLEVRLAAARALGDMNPPDKEIHLALAHALKDENSEVRLAAVSALDKIKPADKEIHLALAHALKDENSMVRLTAIFMLGEIKPADKEIHLALAHALKDEDPLIRKKAIDILGEIKPSDKEIHLALVHALKDEKSEVRYSATNILGRIGPSDKEVHLALAHALKDEDAEVRYSAADILGRIGPSDKEVHLALTRALKDENSEVRLTAARALGDINPPNKEIHLALAHALKDEDSRVRFNAAHALGKIKPPDKEVHLALVHALRDEDLSVKESAAETLGEIKPPDKEVHLALAHALKDEVRSVRYVALYILKKIKPKDKDVLMLIVQALKHPTANDADPSPINLLKFHAELVQLLNDPDVGVRNDIKSVLMEIFGPDLGKHPDLKALHHYFEDCSVPMNQVIDQQQMDRIYEVLKVFSKKHRP